MKKTILMVVALLCAFSCFSQVVDFEDLTLNPNSSWIGADGTGQFTSSYLTLYNDYDINYGSWQGFAYTNGTDAETNSYTNLSSCVGHGAGNSANYVTAYIGSDWMGDFSPIPVAMKINTENAGNFVNRGAYFCMPVLLKKYVDNNYATHNYYFKLKASAYANGTLVGEREIMMADFTEGHSYKMDDWTFVDLSWINGADSLNFIALSNDDAGGYGINTPAYFCMDNFGARNPYPEIVDFEELTLEPNSDWTGDPYAEEGSEFTSSYLTFYNYNMENMYWEGFAYTNGTDSETYSYTNNSAVAGHGNRESSYYVTAYMGWGGGPGKSGIKIDTDHAVNFENRGAYFCLPTYVSKYVDDANANFIANHRYYSIKITAYADETELANREIVMADFREDRTYKMDDWTFVDLSWINGADSLYFEAVTDDGATPYYFSMDDFGAMAPVTITASAGENGTITPSGEIEVFYGSNKEFTIVPAEGYRVASVMVDGNTNVADNLVDGVYTFVNVIANHTINATFEVIPPRYTITATASEGGSISPAEVTVDEGDDADFTIAANEGYRLVSVIVDAETENEANVTESVENNVYTFENVTANHTIAATFELIPVINYTEIVDFEELTLEPNSSWIGEDETGHFTSSYLTLYNDYSISEYAGQIYESWQGFAYTNGTDVETYDFDNISSATGHGVNNSENYAVCYVGSEWDYPYAPIPSGIRIDTEHSGNFENRGAYFCLSYYCSKYISDNYPTSHSYYKIIITAFANGTQIGSRDVVMADFSDDNTYKMDEWTFVDLSWINGADSINFVTESNDPTYYTPNYFCMDDFGAPNPGPVYVSNNIAESLSLDAYFDAAGMLNLSCENRINDVYVYDMAGRLVMTVAVNDNNISMPFDVVNGMYIISARTEKGMATCKVINNR